LITKALTAALEMVVVVALVALDKTDLVHALE
jgi:hypothetical protein